MNNIQSVCGWEEAGEIKMEVPITQKYTLSIEEASNLTGIGRDQIYDWAKTDDTFPVFKIGSKYVIESGLLHEWLRNRCKNRVGMESTRVMRILKRRAQG